MSTRNKVEYLPNLLVMRDGQTIWIEGIEITRFMSSGPREYLIGKSIESNSLGYMTATDVINFLTRNADEK